jgi:FHS family L-fucose permease-like MFS transporter
MGGGVVSLLQGFLSKNELLGIQWGYLVGIVCFLYLAFYGWQMRKLLAGDTDMAPVVE